MVPEALAGKAVVCDHCQTETPVPPGSVPDVRLIYHAGGNETGTPTLLNDVPALLLGGTLKPNDLIWKGGKWQQLCDVFGELEHHHTSRTSERAQQPLENTLGPADPIVFTTEDHPLADAASRARRSARRRFWGRVCRTLGFIIAALALTLVGLLLARRSGLLG